MSHNITVQGGTSVRLPTAGKYCDRDILITAEGGGIDTSGATALPPDILYGKTACVDGEMVTGTMPEIGQMIEVLTRTTPDVSIPRGYHDGTGLVYIDLESKMVTPSNVGQTVEPSDGKVLSAVRVNGDANLIPANIAEGVTIFGVTGTHSGGEDLTSVIDQQATLITQLETALQNAASGGGGGASVETCTVNYDDGGVWYRVTYVALRNGSIQQVIVRNETQEGAFALTDVVNGSNIAVDAMDSIDPSCVNCELLEDVEEIYGVYTHTFKINGNASIFG